MADRFMVKEYEQPIMSDKLKTRIINSCERLESIDRNNRLNAPKRKGVRFAVAAMAALMIMTVSVYAASDWYYDVFYRLFGSSTDNAADVYSHPEVEVLSNTFEGLDIEISGIAATDNILYVLIDITATDGTIFDTTDIGDGGPYVTALGNEINLHNPHHYSTHFFAPDIEDDAREELNGIGRKSWGGTASIIDIPDGDELDNHMSIAWVETFDLCKYPGSVVVLSFNSISHSDKKIKDGAWKVKFTVPEQQYDEFNRTVYQKTELLRNEVFDYSTDSEYIYDEITINTIKLDTLSLEYTWTADDEKYLSAHTFHAWLEMKDGSTVGYPDITEAAYNGLFRGGGRQKGCQGTTKCMFDEPINLNEVKIIHIGTDLKIDVN